MSWIERAKVGDKVILINDLSSLRSTDWGANLDLEFPSLGVVYTIREIVPSPYSAGDIGIRLGEILNMPNGLTENGGYCEKPDFVAEVAFDHRDFRPVEPIKKGMQILRAVLNGQPVKEDA